MRIEREVGFPVGCERAWDVLLDWEAQARWMKDADRVEVVSPIREGIGTTIAVRTRVFGVPLFTEMLEVVAWDPPHALEMAHRSWIGGTGTWQLTPAGRGCRFRWIEDVSLPVPLVGEFALAVYRPFLGRLMQTALWDLRAVIERTQRPSDGA